MADEQDKIVLVAIARAASNTRRSNGSRYRQTIGRERFIANSGNLTRPHPGGLRGWSSCAGVNTEDVIGKTRAFCVPQTARKI